MKQENQFLSEKFSGTALNEAELIQLNGGDADDVAYAAGIFYVFSTAHILTGGLSSIFYLIKKAT